MGFSEFESKSLQQACPDRQSSLISEVKLYYVSHAKIVDSYGTL